MRFVLSICLLAFTGAAFASDLDGRWRFSCVPFDDFHEDITYEFQGDLATQKRINYGDDYCRMPMVESNWVWRFGVDQGQVDFELVGQTFTPRFPGVVEHLNRTSYCGYSDWALNRPKEVTGRTCDSFTFPAAGSVVYQIFSLSEGTLLFGDDRGDNNGSASDRRPTELNPLRPYRRF